ncbi:sn-glycerol-3-phosphate ABC transporter ATP-binding protein UgpC [Labrys wisconsinensis]|uniref:Sn-glycerol 3-phosphate transport system ATP-binding protein n=1 Tax=Labrys wisconsinensis TaxID=425677 RepID=A0ABU0J3X5_9HYPH|nr:sn-glycerol-3-phosphate ABC transporter ATP-binding protein UgpC [Labrys wisconsinensis]MDQ0468971.1 sn-glycerol 3-phosphate transport system ATP-binding protein [Labrys wisconsinensis]
MTEIAMRKVRKSYGRTEIVHGVDLEIRQGEFIVVLGPSGCGKSTLLRMVAGLEEITSGEIAIGGTVVNRLEPRQRGCAMVFQNYALYPHMTVAGNIGYALKVARVPKAERQARVLKVATSLGLETMLDRKPAALSGGQRQRVAMGRAMIREPKVFLFDEPLSNLDARLRVQMRAEIRRLHQRLGTTSIFVTHDQVEAMTLADRLVVMNQGRVEQVGTPSAVFTTPATRFVAGFIGSPPMNLLDGEVEADGAFVFAGRHRIALAGSASQALRGQKLTLGVRPEAIAIGPPDTPGSLQATVDFVEDLGTGRIVQTDLDGMPFAVAIADARSLSPGQPVGLSVPPDAAHLFSRESGLRLDGATAEPARILAA